MAGWQDAPAVDGAKRPAWQSAPEEGGRKAIATTPDGGTVWEMPDGTRAFSSPSYATNDPAKIAEIMEGATAAEMAQGYVDQAALDAAPVSARAIKAVEGVPGLGSYGDEAVGAVFGDDARDAWRMTSGAMDREHPWQSLGLGVAGGLAATAPVLMAAGPSVAGNSLARNMALGAGAGATEGAVRGFGAGEGGAQDRFGRGLVDALIGGTIGAAIPAVAHGVGAAYGGARNWWAERQGVGNVADQLGISRPAGRLASDVLGTDDPQRMQAALSAAGPDAMLADAGPTARGALDTVIQSPGEGARTALTRIDDRAAAAGQRVTGALDQTLGAPAGIEAVKEGVRTGTSAARRTAYDAAYAVPIDYSTGAAGDRLLALQDRLPAKAIAYANELMRLSGDQSSQILAQVADDGAVTFSRLPDVRQWDYIKQALGQLAESGEGAGALGGQTRLGSAYQGLARDVRDLLAEAVPEYRTALDTATDAIGRVKAVDTGAKLLGSGVTREQAARAIDGMTAPELAAVKQGVRQSIDDMLASVRAVATDPNLDVREAYKAWTQLSSRAAQDKMAMLLGDEWPALQQALAEAGSALGLRASVAANSRTHARGIFNEMFNAAYEPSALAKGEPLGSAKEVWQRAMGATQSQIQAARAADRAGLADLLTRPNPTGILQMFEDARKAHPILPGRGQGLIGLIMGGGAGAAPTLGSELSRRLFPQ